VKGKASDALEWPRGGYRTALPRKIVRKKRHSGGVWRDVRFLAQKKRDCPYLGGS